MGNIVSREELEKMLLDAGPSCDDGYVHYDNEILDFAEDVAKLVQSKILENVLGICKKYGVKTEEEFERSSSCVER